MYLLALAYFGTLFLSLIVKCTLHYTVYKTIANRKCALLAVLINNVLHFVEICLFPVEVVLTSFQHDISTQRFA